MRRILLSMLLAGIAATPAIAQRDYSDRREARQQARSERQEARSERREAVEQRREAADDRRQVREERIEHRQQRVQAPPPELRQRLQQRSLERDSARQMRIDQRQPAVQRVQVQAGEARQRSEQRREQLRESREALRQRMNDRATPPISNTPQPNTQPPPPATVRPGPAPSWNSNWRHSDRHDWKKHRNRYRSLFHLGFYYDPFGWGYRPYSIGWRMWPSYYSSHYWLNDPWQYRLPWAPPGTRWIRYYDDAILVDMWSGQVIDVIHGFFW